MTTRPLLATALLLAATRLPLTAAPALCQWENGYQQKADVLGYNANGLQIRADGKESWVRADMVHAVRLLPTDAWTQAEQLAEAGHFTEAAKLMRPLAEEVRSLMPLRGNVDYFVFGYAQVLRQAGRHAELADYFDALPVRIPARRAGRAQLILAMSLAARGETERAGAALARARDKLAEGGSDPYLNVAEARVALASGDTAAATDALARYLADQRPGDADYAEALWLAALAYELPPDPSLTDPAAPAPPPSWNDAARRQTAAASLRAELALHYPGSFWLHATLTQPPATP